jgi:uncharacterized protein YdiU (UPF0061 family)
MYLGEIINRRDERWELQYKGAGPTHFSRSADGRKVLRSSLREFLCSEANAALGVPTTRAVSIVTSDTLVERDPTYDGNVRRERASVVARAARSFLRFGSFEICKPEDPITGRAGPSEGHNEILAVLLDHVSELLLPREAAVISEKSAGDASSGAHERQVARQGLWRNAFAEMVRRTARLVACWQSIGFVHGVLNTDNMSVMGDTLDYGPFGFMQAFDPDFASNLSDNTGRYTYATQPEICRWNCGKLAEAVQPILPAESTREALDGFSAQFEAEHLRLFRRKLGLLRAGGPGQPVPQGQGSVTGGAPAGDSTPSGGRPAASDADDAELVRTLLDTMRQTAADFTWTFRSLASVPPHPAAVEPVVEAILPRCASVQEQAAALETRARQRGPQAPVAQLAQLVQLAEADPTVLSMVFQGGSPQAVLAELREQLAKGEQADADRARAAELRAGAGGEVRKQQAKAWRAWLLRYQARVRMEDEAETQQEGCTLAEAGSRRRARMQMCNPRVVLHNWIAQEAIVAAEAGDFATVGRVLAAVINPFTEGDDHFAGPPLAQFASTCVSCSS